MSFLCGLQRFRRSAVSRTGCSNEQLRYHVRFQVDNRTAHVSPDTIDSRLSVFLLCLVVLWLVVGPPTAFLRGGTGVPWVSCLDPPVCPRVQDDPEAKSQPFLVWLVLLLVSTSLGGPIKVNVIVPFCSCTCCWNRSRFTCVEGSDINWLSFMSLIIATENIYKNNQCEACVQMGFQC